MTEVPEHLRKRAEAHRLKLQGKEGAGSLEPPPRPPLASNERVFKVINCAYCNVIKPWPWAFPERISAMCWECWWNQHMKDEHPPKRRWKLRSPFTREEVHGWVK